MEVAKREGLWQWCDGRERGWALGCALLGFGLLFLVGRSLLLVLAHLLTSLATCNCMCV